MGLMPNRGQQIGALKSQIEALKTEQKRLVPLALNSEFPKDEDAAMALGYVQIRLKELHDQLIDLEQKSE